MKKEELRDIVDGIRTDIDYIESFVSTAINSRDAAKTQGVKELFENKLNDLIVILNHTGMVEYNPMISEKLEWEIIFDVLRNSVDDLEVTLLVGNKNLKEIHKLYKHQKLYNTIKEQIVNGGDI